MKTMTTKIGQMTSGDTVLHLHCWTDGSAIHSEGMGIGDCGIGIVVTNGDHILFCIGEYIGSNTSNYAEFYAILRCLEEIRDRVGDEIYGIDILSDSEVAVNGLEGISNIVSDNLIPIIQQIEDVCDDIGVIPTYIWTPAHSDDRLNRLSDMLAYTSSSGQY